jgi:hypothetical protein
MPRFFFFERSVAILIEGFSKSKFTNPSIDNFEHDGFFEYLQWRSSHVCLFGKHMDLDIIVELIFYRNSLH